MRKEQDIFDEIARLCLSPGYAHAIAHLCFRDNIVGYGDKLKAEDLLPGFSANRLIRTDISTLIGLLIKKDIDYTLPSPSVIQKLSDRTEALLGARTGLTIHCNDNPIVIAERRLRNHCELRKYTEKADSWFGVCVWPEEASLRFGLNLESKWVQNAEMDAKTSGFPKPKKIADLGAPAAWRKKKIGRNQPCPCGSGLKYKKCCLAR